MWVGGQVATLERAVLCERWHARVPIPIPIQIATLERAVLCERGLKTLSDVERASVLEPLVISLEPSSKEALFRAMLHTAGLPEEDRIVLARQAASGRWQVAGGKCEVGGGKCEVGGGKCEVEGGKWEVGGGR